MAFYHTRIVQPEELAWSAEGPRESAPSSALRLNARRGTGISSAPTPALGIAPPVDARTLGISQCICALTSLVFLCNKAQTQPDSVGHEFCTAGCTHECSDEGEGGGGGDPCGD